jgi:acylglycerol lipase
MTGPQATSSTSRFRFSERAEPFCLGEGAPRVHGYAWWHPSPHAVVILLHGLQSHAQWFADCADTLVERGLAVYAVDRHGSGSSPGERGDIARYSVWFEEVAKVVRLARAVHPSAPVHLVGHCFGANIALGCILTQRPAVRSLIMLTPGLHIRPDYTRQEKLQILLCGLARRQARFPVPQHDDLFTRDPDVLEWIHRDSLGARTLTAGCLLQINSMMMWLRRSVGSLRVPVLVLEALRDRISDNPRNRALLDRALGPDCRYVSFDAEHFLLAEACRDQVIQTLVAWIGESAISGSEGAVAEAGRWKAMTGKRGRGDDGRAGGWIGHRISGERSAQRARVGAPAAQAGAVPDRQVDDAGA